jgi:hypothetical protein
VSAASITPFAYLIPRMDVPVTIGRLVRSFVEEEREEEVEGAREVDPPEESVSDIFVESRISCRRSVMKEGMVDTGIYLSMNEC